MLAIPGWRAALAAADAPCVAVTPLVAGQAIKGPTAKIMGELGLALDVASIVAHYGDLIDGFVLDRADADKAAALGLPVATAQTIMRTLADRDGLARETISFCQRLAGRKLRS